MSEPTFTGKLVWPEGRDPQVLVDALKGCIKELRNYSRARKVAVAALKQWEGEGK